MTWAEQPDGLMRDEERLVQWLISTRPAWSEMFVRGVIREAAGVAMTWPQVAVGLVRLVFDLDAWPRDLIPDSRSPLTARPQDPEVAHEGAAVARELLAAMQKGRQT
jgi:hypothetical protein